MPTARIATSDQATQTMPHHALPTDMVSHPVLADCLRLRSLDGYAVDVPTDVLEATDTFFSGAVRARRAGCQGPVLQTQLRAPQLGGVVDFMMHRLLPQQADALASLEAAAHILSYGELHAATRDARQRTAPEPIDNARANRWFQELSGALAQLDLASKPDRFRAFPVEISEMNTLHWQHYSAGEPPDVVIALHNGFVRSESRWDLVCAWEKLRASPLGATFDSFELSAFAHSPRSTGGGATKAWRWSLSVTLVQPPRRPSQHQVPHGHAAS